MLGSDPSVLNEAVLNAGLDFNRHRSRVNVAHGELNFPSHLDPLVVGRNLKVLINPDRDLPWR
jgi:hypothetical protein